MWKRVIVGVDESPAAGAAAALGVHLAQVLGGDCVAVHAVSDLQMAFVEEDVMDRSADLRVAMVAGIRRRLAAALRAWVPEGTIRRLILRVGRPAEVLREVARELGADAVILGGKHHSTLGRWVSGSTAHDVVHRLRLPVLVVAGSSPDRPFQRILVAVDTSEAAPGTAATARILARALGAQLRGMSVIEPPVPLPDVTPVLTQAEFARRAQRALARGVWPRLGRGADTVVAQQGPVPEAIRREASRWKADLVVIGSHGKGLGERLLQGSLTERLLNDLPTSLLVVPPGALPRQRARRSHGSELQGAVS
jgi:nucleotide-binding universal stress UspA family protein